MPLSDSLTLHQERRPTLEFATLAAQTASWGQDGVVCHLWMLQILPYFREVKSAQFLEQLGRIKDLALGVREQIVRRHTPSLVSSPRLTPSLSLDQLSSAQEYSCDVHQILRRYRTLHMTQCGQEPAAAANADLWWRRAADHDTIEALRRGDIPKLPAQNPAPYYRPGLPGPIPRSQSSEEMALAAEKEVGNLRMKLVA